MKVESEGKILRVLIGESDRYQGSALHEVILRRAHELGLAGATVLQGIAGFGAHSRIHTAKVLRLSEDLPIVVEIIDSEDKIRTLMAEIDTMMDAAGSGGVVTLEAAEQIIRYHHQ